MSTAARGETAVQMTFEPYPRARQARHVARQRQRIAHHRAAGGPLVAQERAGGARAQLLDAGEAPQPQGFAQRDRHEGERGGGGERRAEPAERFIAAEQILDQARHAEPDAEHREPAERGPEQRAPGKAAPRRRIGRDDRRQRRLRLHHDPHGAAGGAPRLRGHHHVWIVEPKGRRPAVMLVHGILSPIRNCSARSRRMWGSIN
jgi:hypothetical protein